MTKRGTGGTFPGLPGEASDIYANLEYKIQVLQLALANNPGLGGQIISANTGVITSAEYIFLTNTDPVLNIELPDAFLNRGMTIFKANAATSQQINLNRSAADAAANGTINDTVSDLAIIQAGLDSAATYQSWTVGGAGPAAWYVNDGPTNIAEAAKAFASSLANRIADLESPPLFLNGGASVDWTTNEQCILNYSLGNATINLKATLLEWPLFRTRVISKYNTTAFTGAVQAEPTHYVNGVQGGLCVLEGSADIPDTSTGAGRWYVQRMGAEEWWVSRGA